MLRRAGVRVPILVFGALSVSDLDGAVRVRADADDLDARRGAGGAGGRGARGATTIGYHLKIDTGMNRLGFRHDNLRADAAGAAGQPEPAARGGLHALRLRRRCRRAPLFDEQRERFERRCAVVDGLGGRRRRRACGTPATAPRCCATRASGTTSSGPGCCSTASCRRRWRRRFRSSR